VRRDQITLSRSIVEAQGGRRERWFPHLVSGHASRSTVSCLTATQANDNPERHLLSGYVSPTALQRFDPVNYRQHSYFAWFSKYSSNKATSITGTLSAAEGSKQQGSREEKSWNYRIIRVWSWLVFKPEVS